MKQSYINKTSYNNIVEAWSTYRNRTINSCIADFCKLLPPCSHILDIGCGTGCPIDTYFIQLGHSVVGIDSSEKMIEAAEQLNLSNATYIVKDFMDYDSTECFDAVVAFDSIFHIEEAQQPSIYKKVSRLLAPNGYFIFTHGKERGTVKGTMFSQEFVYSALDACEVKRLLLENDMDILFWQEDYEEETTGTRDLLVIAKKIHCYGE